MKKSGLAIPRPDGEKGRLLWKDQNQYGLVKLIYEGKGFFGNIPFTSLKGYFISHFSIWKRIYYGGEREKGLHSYRQGDM